MGTQLFLVTGNDDAGIDTAARRIVTRVAGETPDPMALEVFRQRDDLSEAELIHEVVLAILSPPFLGGIKTIWWHWAPGFAGEGKAGKAAEVQARRRLVEVLAAGLPPGLVVVISGPDADPARDLGRVCAEQGEVIDCHRPDINKDKNWRGQMSMIVQQRARAKGLALATEAVEYLVDVLGTDTGRVETELEKLVCYLGAGASSVPLARVTEICQGDGEVNHFAFEDAVGNRQMGESLSVVNTLFARLKDSERDRTVISLLKAIAGRLESLLQIRVFMQERRDLRSPEAVRGCLARFSDEEKAKALRQGFEFVALHPYRLQRMLPQAVNFTGAELVRALPLIRDAYWKCVSGGVANKRVLLEDVLVRILSPAA